MIRFGMICSVIFSAVRTGTPLCSSVARVRANWANRFNLTTFPTTGAFIFQASSLRVPVGVDLKRKNSTANTKTDNPINSQVVPLLKKSPKFISARVARGSATFNPWKIDMNRGSMNVIKKTMITTPTHATMHG